MEFLVIPQLSRTIIECYSAGSDSDDCGRFSIQNPIGFLTISL